MVLNYFECNIFIYKSVIKTLMSECMHVLRIKTDRKYQSYTEAERMFPRKFQCTFEIIKSNIFVLTYVCGCMIVYVHICVYMFLKARKQLLLLFLEPESFIGGEVVQQSILARQLAAEICLSPLCRAGIAKRATTPEF